MKKVNKINSIDELLSEIKEYLKGIESKEAFIENGNNKIQILSDLNELSIRYVYENLELMPTTPVGLIDARNYINYGINNGISLDKPTPGELSLYKPKIRYYKINEIIDIVNNENEVGLNIYPIKYTDSHGNIQDSYLIEVMENGRTLSRANDPVYGRTFLYDFGDAGGISKESEVHPCAYAYGNPSHNGGFPSNC